MPSKPDDLLPNAKDFMKKLAISEADERAVRNGKTEVVFIRFPVDVCTDRGRAINQQERGWESTLTGLPKELYDAWAKYFRPRGYKLRAEIVQFSGDRPSDIGMTLSWN